MTAPMPLPSVFSNELSGFQDSPGSAADSLGWSGAGLQVWGGSGMFRLGALGSDELRGSDGNDILIGLSGHDRLSGGEGNDLVLAGSGHDRAEGGRGHDAIAMGAGNDTAWGGPGKDFMLGGAGDDRLYGGADRDLLFGGSGVDVVDGGSGSDLVFGGDGDDVLSGGAGNDFLFGGVGDDVLHGGSGRDVIDGGSGSDTIVVDAGDWRDTSDTDLLVSPMEDLLVFELGSEVEAIRFSASAFAHSSDNTISGSLFTGAIIFEDGDKAGDADAEVVWEGSATDFEGAVATAGLVDDVQVAALADLFGRVPSDELEVLGTLFLSVEAEDGTYSYATDFRGEEGNFAFEFVAPNGSSAAQFVWDDSGFAIASETALAEDSLVLV